MQGFYREGVHQGASVRYSELYHSIWLQSENRELILDKGQKKFPKNLLINRELWVILFDKEVP